jgi:hypothetical protein
MVWVMNRRRHTVHELDCWKLRKMWANPDLDLSDSDYDKMRAADSAELPPLLSLRAGRRVTPNSAKVSRDSWASRASWSSGQRSR